MREAIKVDPPKTCLVRSEDGIWYPGKLSWWYQRPDGTWDGYVLAPEATGFSTWIWIRADRLRRADGY